MRRRWSHPSIPTTASSTDFASSRPPYGVPRATTSPPTWSVARTVPETATATKHPIASRLNRRVTTSRAASCRASQTTPTRAPIQAVMAHTCTISAWVSR